MRSRSARAPPCWSPTSRGPSRWSPSALPESLDSVVHAAGRRRAGPGVGELSVDAWADAARGSTWSRPRRSTRVALPALRAARGTVVFVNSGAGLHGAPAVVGVRRLEARPACPRRLAARRGGRTRRAGHHASTRVAPPPRCRRRCTSRRARTTTRLRGSDPRPSPTRSCHVLDLPRDATIADRHDPPGSSLGLRAPVEGADQHHPQLDAGALDDLPSRRPGDPRRRGSPRRWRPSRSRSGWTAPAGPRPTRASVPGSRARSVASSRSKSSISWRIASRTAGGPAARSRAMNRKCARCWCTCSTRIEIDRSTTSASAGSPRRMSRISRAQRLEGLVDQRQPERLDRVEVSVEGGRHDPDLLGDLAQRQRGESAVVGEVECRVEDGASGALLLLHPRDRHRHARRLSVRARLFSGRPDVVAAPVAA